MTTPAHSEHLAAHYLLYYPEHEPRETAPGHAAFQATKRRLKAAGLWRCHVQGCVRTDIELHHDALEFSLLNGADVQKFDHEYGLHLTDADFADYVNGPEGTSPYCSQHHRGTIGVHNLRTPEWKALLVWKDGLPPPGQTEH